jgi:hypothetical protein
MVTVRAETSRQVESKALPTALVVEHAPQEKRSRGLALPSQPCRAYHPHRVKPAPPPTRRLSLEETEEDAMGAQTTTRRPVQPLARSIVLFVIVLAIIVVVVAASGRPGAASTTPAGVHHAVPAPSPGPMAAAGPCLVAA